MTSKAALAIGVLVGGLAGGIGGFVLNDLVEKDSVENVRAMCQQYCEQDQVDALFDSLEREAREGSR